MVGDIRTGMWRRAMVIVLVVGGLLLPMGVRATEPLDPDTETFYRRLTIGLLHSGKAPGDVMDYVVNLRLCTGLYPTNANNLLACMKPYIDKVGVSLSQMYDYAGLIGYFSVYDGFLKNTGGMVVSTGHGINGTRTDSAGGTVKFDFYPYDGGYDFDYKSAIDEGTGYMVWFNDCMLLGRFVSEKLHDDNGRYNTGVVVFRRCGFA